MSDQNPGNDPAAQPPQGTPPSGPPQGPPSGPPGGYTPPGGYVQPQYAYPQPAAVGTNGFSIASIICAFLCAPLGLVFGFIARNQIKTTHEGGDGLALAGIIISIVFLVLGVIYVILVIAFFHSVSQGLNNLNNFNFFVPTQTP